MAGVARAWWRGATWCASQTCAPGAPRPSGGENNNIYNDIKNIIYYLARRNLVCITDVRTLRTTPFRWEK